MKSGKKGLSEREDHLGRKKLQRFLRNKLSSKAISKIELLIVKAKDFGLPQVDVENAEISLDYNEFGLSFDTVLQQLYEHNIKIDRDFYNLAMETCEIMNIEKEKYQFLTELLVN